MSQLPTLKLKFSKPGEQQPKPSSTPAASASSSNGPTKLKLKIGPRPDGPANDASPKPKETVKGTKLKIRAPAPNKKRVRDGQQDDAAAAPAGGAGETPHPPIKRIKLSTKPKPPPQIRFKRLKGEPPKRPHGVGYDSEASDTEIDPALEEEFILRMQPGEDCDYIRQAIEEKRFGPRSQGGADISFKPLTRDGRRATVTVRGNMYAATLVDLPCIVEAMKSWDKRGWFKAADICQMLLVLGRVESESEAMNYPLPKDVDPTTFQYAHGLTPPLRWVRKRRFRKRISNRTIEAVEMEVARLLKQDQEAIKPPTFEVMDYAQWMREQQSEEEADQEFEGYDEEQDAEGEPDEQYYDQGASELGEDAFEDALAAEMEAALAAHADAAAAEERRAAPEAQAEAVGAEVEAEAEGETFEAGTPHTKRTTTGETSGDEDEETEESAAEDEPVDMDEDALEAQRQLQELREEVAELENQVAAETQRWEQMKNPILKAKLRNRVQELKQALSLKKVALGEGED
ncbi:hypothetical protein VTO42DRAFT_7976 [Malbranchea cinnamomea]